MSAMVGSHGSMSKIPTTTCLVGECHIIVACLEAMNYVVTCDRECSEKS